MTAAFRTMVLIVFAAFRGRVTSAASAAQCVDDGMGSCKSGTSLAADSMLIQRSWSQRGRKMNDLNTPPAAEYDCNEDGALDCGTWDYAKAKCANHAYCGHQFKVGDSTLDSSCRCRSIPLVADYDCNGDGAPDCGEWDYEMGMCANQAYCGHLYQVGDWTLGSSCRCRRCNDPMFNGTAFGDPQLQKPDGSIFNAMSWSTFRNWADHLDTCAPWIMPKSDADLKMTLSYAKSKGYKVRISGAGHSAGGIVTDGKDKNTFVISLAEYKTSGEWEFGTRRMHDGSMRATVNAGWTQAHLYAKIRPLGFFLPAQTAGYFFQLGGIVANSVHGGAYNAGFVHSYVTRMRVMLHDGSIKVIDDEEEVRYWRCSFGLIGIILGVEFQLEHRSHLQMYSVTKKMDSWNAEEFWNFVKQDAEADVPSDIVKEGGLGTRASWNGEYFVDFINDADRPTLSVFAQKANSSVDADFEGELGIPDMVQENYDRILNKKVIDGWHGGMTWGEAARRDGAPPKKILGLDVNNVLDALKWVPIAKTMSMAAITNIPRLVRTQSNDVNDGFFLTDSPAVLAGAYFVHPSKAFAAMDKLRDVQLASRGSKEFMWNLPGEYRFINVSDSAVLQPIEPGLWFNAQVISFPDMAKNDYAWEKNFKEVEDHWVTTLGAKPHMGKLWGFQTQSDGSIETFSDEFACSIYSDATKVKFLEYRDKQDPDGLFFAGLGAKVLSPCT